MSGAVDAPPVDRELATIARELRSLEDELRVQMDRGIRDAALRPGLN